MQSSTAPRERERQLWRELADALERAQVALLEHDLAGFQSCTQAQQLGCRQISAIATDGTEDQELSELRRRVWHLSRMERALLRRALHSLLILHNLARSPLYHPGTPASNSWSREG